MSPLRIRILRGAVVAAALLIVPACGEDSSDGKSTPTPGGTNTPAPIPTPTTASVPFEGVVTSVDLPAGTLTLANGQVIDTSAATFDREGDLHSLQATSDAVGAGSLVRAEGTGSPGEGGVIEATSIKVEVDD